MEFHHRTLNLPIHPGDTIFTVNDGRGWKVEPETVRMVCITETELLIKWMETDLDYDDHFEQEWFISETQAAEWAERNKPSPPYDY